MKRFITSLGITQIFLSLLLIILVMSISTYYVYQSSISNIYDTVKENNKLATRSTIQFFDNTFQTINSMFATINQKHNEAFPVLENGNLDPIGVQLIIEDIRSMQLNTDYIEEIIIIYDDHNLAITSQGTIDFSVLFSKKYVNNTYTSNYWSRVLKEEKKMKIFPTATYNVMNTQNQVNKQNQLMFVVSDNRYSKFGKRIMVAINVDQLMSYVGKTHLIPGASLKVLDSNHQAILSTDNHLELMEVLNDIYFNELDDEVSVKKENYEYTVFNSDYNNLIYISKVPFEFKNIESVYLGNRTIIVVSILCALALAVFLSFYLFKPVKHIMRVLGGENSKGKDFSKIYSAIIKLKEEAATYQKQLDYVDEEMKRTTFLQLLDGYSHVEEYDLQLQKYYPEFFLSNYFVLSQLVVREKTATLNYSLEVEVVAQKIRDALKKKMPSSSVQVFHNTHQRFTVMIGMNEANLRDQCMRDLKQSIIALEKGELTGFQIWACVSKTYRNNTKNCRLAYKEVENAYKYRNVKNKDKVVDAQHIEFIWNVYLPFESLDKVSNFVVTGKKEEAIQLIKHTIKENVDRNVHEHQLKYVIHSIFYYLFRNMGSYTTSMQELYSIENEFFHKLEFIDNPDEWLEALLDVVDKFSSLCHSSHVKTKLNPTFISKYIERHYMESMYLDHIAEVMETTPKYFSNYFKKAFGVNYIEYLNKVRLSHARDMLIHTNLTVGEIGEKTGYLNSSTFTTTFKKYYGISPSEFRKQYHESNAAAEA